MSKTLILVNKTTKQVTAMYHNESDFDMLRSMHSQDESSSLHEIEAEIDFTKTYQFDSGVLSEAPIPDGSSIKVTG